MSRLLGLLILCLFTSMLMAPFAVLLEFHLHRAQIEKELCVQRDVIEDMRTCHGECQLSKRFRALELESSAEFPQDRIQVRLEPQVPVARTTPGLFLPVSDRDFLELDMSLLPGHFPPDDQVPRA